MKKSIRNQFPGTIKSIVSDKVLSEVIVETASGEVASVITTHSVEDMTELVEAIPDETQLASD